MSELQSYKTLAAEGKGTFVDRKSEFIAYAKPVKSEDEALAFVASVRERHKDARHCVYAYLMKGGAHKRCSDDGEPSGTAGKPILDMLEKNAIEDSVIAVVRYFGGILLGTGGLVRAYTAAASEAVSAAGVRVLRPRVFISVSASYNDWSRLERALNDAGAEIMSTEYGEGISAGLSVAAGEEDRISVLIRDLSAGRSSSKVCGEGFA